MFHVSLTRQRVLRTCQVLVAKNTKTEALAIKLTKTNKRRLKFAFRLIQKIIPSSLSILSHRLFNNTRENHVITCLSLK